LSLLMSVPSSVRRGLTANVDLDYRNITEPGIVELTLTPELIVQLTVPMAGQGSDGQVIWASLPGPSGSVRARVLVDPAALPGSTLSLAATLQDAADETTSVEETTYVRDEAGLGDPTITISAPSTVKRGLTTDVSVRYDNIIGPATVALVLPPELASQLTVPAAIVEGNTLTWLSVPAPGGSVKTRVLVDPTAEPGATLNLFATVNDAAGYNAEALESITVREEPSSDPTMTITMPSTVKQGLTTDISIRYSDILGPASLTVLLPPELTARLMVPAGIIDGRTVTWPALAVPGGSLKVRVLVDANATPGSVLEVSATLEDRDRNASGNTETTVRN